MTAAAPAVRASSLPAAIRIEMGIRAASGNQPLRQDQVILKMASLGKYKPTRPSPQCRSHTGAETRGQPAPRQLLGPIVVEVEFLLAKGVPPAMASERRPAHLLVRVAVPALVACSSTALCLAAGANSLGLPSCGPVAPAVQTRLGPIQQLRRYSEPVGQYQSWG